MSAQTITALSAIAVALMAMGGTIYAARQSRSVGDRAQDVAAFQALTGGLQSELGRVKSDLAETREELRETRSALRDAVGYIRLVVDEMRRHDLTPPPVPNGILDWTP